MAAEELRVADNDADKYRAPALDKGLDILELLAGREGSLSQVEIAKALDRSIGEIFRMLDRLVRRGYVRRTEEDRYALTLKLFEMAHWTPPLKRLINEAMPLMRNFAHDTQQACHLVTYDKNRLIVVAQVDPPGYWSVAIRVGAQINMLDTGSGHVFLAFASEADRSHMLRKADGSVEEITPELRKHLDHVSREACEKMPSLQIPGVTNLAAPIFGALGGVIATLASPFIDRLDAEGAISASQALELLKIAAREISALHAGEERQD
jgi:DNA-binding IclR family transcriptional regulator